MSQDQKSLIKPNSQGANVRLDRLEEAVPRLPNLSLREVDIKHTVTHRISTTGPPRSCRLRSLAPDRLKIAKAEFEHVLELDIIRQSDSCWASPLQKRPATGDRVDLAVDTIEQLLREKYDETENLLGHAQIIQVLKFCLKTYFTFDRTIYEQVKGTPMGSPISGLIAETVLQRLESLVFRHHRPKFWARYVDNTFVVIERHQVLKFKEHLNAVFSDIEFTMEEEENNQPAFLDVLVCRKECGGLKTKVFRKSTNTTQILNFNSNHSIGPKRNCVRVLFRRVETHCSEMEDKVAELQYFRRVMRANGYPRNFVNQCIRKGHQRPNPIDPKFWGALPYVKDVSEATLETLRLPNHLTLSSYLLSVMAAIFDRFRLYRPKYALKVVDEVECGVERERSIDECSNVEVGTYTPPSEMGPCTMNTMWLTEGPALVNEVATTITEAGDVVGNTDGDYSDEKPPAVNNDSQANAVVEAGDSQVSNAADATANKAETTATEEDSDLRRIPPPQVPPAPHQHFPPFDGREGNLDPPTITVLAAAGGEAALYTRPHATWPHVLSAMPVDAYCNEQSGIDINYQTDGKLFNIRPPKAHSWIPTASVHELLFVNDCALKTTREEDVQRSVDPFASNCSNFELAINTDKTVIMNKPAPDAEYNGPPTKVNGSQLASVGTSAYLRGAISRNTKIDNHVARPISRANQTFRHVHDSVCNCLEGPRPGSTRLVNGSEDWSSTQRRQPDCRCQKVRLASPKSGGQSVSTPNPCHHFDDANGHHRWRVNPWCPAAHCHKYDKPRVDDCNDHHPLH
ncbi:DNA topoisomerase 2-beta [Sparganum proliferum]